MLGAETENRARRTRWIIFEPRQSLQSERRSDLVKREGTGPDFGALGYSVASPEVTSEGRGNLRWWDDSEVRDQCGTWWDLGGTNHEPSTTVLPRSLGQALK